MVIGLDGATFDILRPMIEKGKLPTLARLMEEGTSGELISVFPPVSPTAWASFITGKNPGKHGIMDFKIRCKDRYDRRVATPSDIGGKNLFNLLSEAGKKVGVAYLSFAGPEGVNSFFISGIFSPSEIHPSSLERKLMKEIDDFKITRTSYGYLPGNEDDFLNKLMRETEKVAEVTFYLLDNYPWNFFITMFLYGDQIQHHFWKYIDPQNPAYDQRKAKKYENVIFEYYQKIDGVIGKILKKIDKNTTLIIMSDHGMGPVYKDVYINHWLRNINLLKLKEIGENSVRQYLLAKLSSMAIADTLAKRYLLGMLSKITTPHLLRKTYKNLFDRLRPTLSHVDWSRTKAYSTGFIGQIFINLKGREPEGIVKAGQEYEELRDYLIRELYKLKNMGTGEKLLDKVFKREELYHGPHSPEGADLFLIMRGMTYITRTDLEFGPYLDSLIGPPRNMESATHRIRGILVIKGPHIVKDFTINNARIIDLAPTILHILGVSIPIDMDGRVLEEVFESQSSLAEQRIRYVKSSKNEKKKRRISEEEEMEIKKRLKALGYID